MAHLVQTGLWKGSRSKFSAPSQPSGQKKRKCFCSTKTIQIVNCAACSGPSWRALPPSRQPRPACLPTCTAATSPSNDQAPKDRCGYWAISRTDLGACASRCAGQAHHPRFPKQGGGGVSNYPPKLIRLSETDTGSILFLDDGMQVAVDVRPSSLDGALTEYGNLPLAALVESRSLGCLCGPVPYDSRAMGRHPKMYPHLNQERSAWHFVGFHRFGHASTSPTTASRQSSSAIRGIVTRPLHEPSHRFSGGAQSPIALVSRASQRNWRLFPHRGCYRACLNAPGGWLCDIGVNLGTGNVKIEVGKQPGHYVE